MNRLNLTDYLLTILIILALVFTLQQAMQKWLSNVVEETSSRIERANYQP